MKIRIERTKRGLPAIWEQGGGFSNTGSAQVVAGPGGQPLKPVYIRRRGPLACGQHALLVIRPGCYIVQADHHRRDFDIEVLRVVEIGEEATCEQVASFSRGEWSQDPPPELEAAIRAAKEKATCYHCRRPHFVAE